MQATLGITTIYVTHDQIEAMTLAHRVAVLEKGVLQQLASPSEIYNNPANLFVAQFIGSPAMNVIHGSLAGSDFMTNGTKVETKVKGNLHKAVAGVRPEDCSVTGPKKGSIEGQIYTTELIGDHTLVTVKWGSDQIVVKAHKDFDGKQGDAVGVILPPENLYIFDETNGERIR
jgi:multiple sugar transport system ATP-binding protein